MLTTITAKWAVNNAGKKLPKNTIFYALEMPWKMLKKHRKLFFFFWYFIASLTI